MKTFLRQANELYIKKKYADAVIIYEEVAKRHPELEKTLRINIAQCKKKLKDDCTVRNIAIEKSKENPCSKRYDNILYIENNTPNTNTDLFDLTGHTPHSECIVVIWVDDNNQALLNKSAIETLNNRYKFELLLLSKTCTKFNFPVNSVNTIAIRFNEMESRESSFIRVFNTGFINKYKYTYLINSIGDITLLNQDIINLADSSNIGIISTKQISSEVIKDQVNSAKLPLSRLLWRKTKIPSKIPSGSVLMRTAILRDFSGTNISADSAIKNNHIFIIMASVFSDIGEWRAVTFDDISQQMILGNLQERPKKIINIIAFYLPQFHIVPENNTWWGNGFTEWHNVVRARPMFRSHYQPRYPADLGFYDLTSQKTQIAQAELAKKYGVHGFCYYYYYFNGKKVLNQPIEQMLQSGKPDFPFCICWANENWSRNWDGQNKHILLAQEYSIQSNYTLIQEFIQFMKDPRYIRHNGKPVLIVYRIKLIPNWIETSQMWRNQCRKAGLGEIHLCSIRFGLEPLEGQPAEHNLDAYVMFPPQDMKFIDVKHEQNDLNKDFSGQIYSYEEVVKHDIARFDKGYEWPVHRGAMMGWDNTARRMTAARIFTGCTPNLYRYWLRNIIKQEQMRNPKDESLVFINAWNEWAEGTTLEPDKRYGSAYLEATHSVISPHLKNRALNENTDSSITLITRPISPKHYIKDLTAPKLLERFQGKAKYNPSVHTVLLCAHISGHQLFGGERSFLDVLEALYRIGMNIVVTLPSSNNKAYINHIANSVTDIYSFPYKQWISAREPDPMVQMQFCDLIAAHNVSVVYSNTIVLIEPALAARQMNRLSIVHVRELISIDDSLRERIGLPVQTIIKTVYERYDFAIANSKATEFTFAREGRTFYVPNAVDAKELALENKLGQRIKVGIVSSNIPKKGIIDFIEVAKLCKDLIDQVEFVVIGPENTQVQQWKKEIETGLLPANLKFLGYRETPKAAMAELNILLNLSSFAESFGRTVAEAMAASRSVIAYQWGALPELVQHGVTGFLVSYGDIRKVSDYVRMLCKNPELIEKLGKAGQVAVAQKFSHETLFKHLDTAITAIRKSHDWQILDTTELKETRSNAVTLVIPVYNAPNEVRNCIDSVLRHTPLHDVEVVIIDDGSTDPQIADILSGYVGKAGIRILKNNKNIGYTKTVNRGLEEAGERDVVLLNSDTIVTPTWLNALRASAYSKPKIGTVTAMSDNAGTFSFPKQGVANPKPEDMSYDQYAMRLIDQTLDCTFPEVPTGSGFCLYIRRDLINEIGAFDELLFPRGYGEENHFCMRALDAGWKNVVTSWAFVFHVRTASFKGEKEALVKAGVDVVTKRYPNYASQVKEAFAGADMNALRSATDVLTIRGEHG